MCSQISNSEEYCREVRSFLSGDHGRTIRVILLNYRDDFKQKPIYKLFCSFASQVNIKKFPPLSEVIYDNSPVNITVADGIIFRIETNITDKIAFGNFNDPNKASGITGAFNEIFTLPDAESVELSCR